MSRPTRFTFSYYSIARTRRVRDENAVRTCGARDRHTEGGAYIKHFPRTIMTCTFMLLSAMALCAALAAASAEEPASPAELRFRRVYAPANRMSDWPTGRR